MDQCDWPLVNVSEVEQSKNTSVAQVIFSNIKEYSFLHSASLIVEPIIQAVNEEMPQVFEFLDSRLLKTSTHIKSILNTEFDSKVVQTSAQWGDYGLTKTPALTNSKIAQKKLFKSEKKSKNKQKKLYDYYWFDVPQVYFPCEKGYNMMKAL